MIPFNLITNPRRAGWLVRAFAMKVAGSPAPTLAPEVAPSIDVNQMDDPALFFLRGERLQSLAYAFAASVGNANQLQLRNPPNSGVLLIITGITHNGASLFQHGTGVQAGDLAGGTLQPQPRDGRWIGVGGTRGTAIASWAQVAAPSVPVQCILPANSLDFHPLQIVVPAGSAWQGANGSVNAADYIAVQYIERPVQAEELQTG